MIRLLLLLVLALPGLADERADILRATHEKITPDTETVVMVDGPWAMVAFFQREAGWSSVLRKFPGEGWHEVYGCRGGPGHDVMIRLGLPRASIVRMIPKRADMGPPTLAELQKVSAGPYYAFLSERAVTAQDLQSKSWWELTLMRNEIFARHGRRFQDPALADYFHNRPWYTGQESPVTVLEAKNAATILEYQKQKKLLSP